MKNLLLILTVFLTVNMLTGQENVGDMIPLAEVPESIALSQYAGMYAQAVVDGNYDLLADLTHEDIIKMGGGKDYLLSDLKSEGELLKGQGMYFSSMEVGRHPEFKLFEEELQTIIPVQYYLVFNDKKVESWANLFAASTDNGVTWKFVSLEKFDEASLREFVANVAPDLVFP